MQKNLPLYETFPALDGLRAISILLVVLGHLPVAMPAWIFFITKRGDLGVEIFFAISGFLVTRSFFQCIDKHRDETSHLISVLKVIKDFFLRRVSRIFPPYYFTLMALAVGAYIFSFFSPRLLNELYDIKAIWWAFPTFMSNYVMPFVYVAVATLGITWSLAFEEQFYVLLILMFFLFGKKRLHWIIIAGGVFSIFARFLYLSQHPGENLKTHLQMILHLRFDAIAWGCLSWIFYERLCFFWANTKRAFITNITIVLGVVLVFIGHRYYPHNFWWLSFIYVFTAIFFAFSVRALTEIQYQNAWVVRLLSHSLLVFIGILSYEIYLVHLMILPPLARIGLNKYVFIYSVLSVSLSIFSAWCLHRFFSVPTQRWIKKATTAQLIR